MISVHILDAHMCMRAFYCAWIVGLPCLDEALTIEELVQKNHLTKMKIGIK